MFLFNSSSVCDTGCEFAQGGGLAVGAILSYFFAGILLCVAPNPIEEEAFVPPAAAAAKSSGQDQVTVEQTQNPDGSVTVTKTTTHPDGSQTVEQTTETPTGDIPGGDVEAQGVSGSSGEAGDTSNLVDAKVN